MKVTSLFFILLFFNGQLTVNAQTNDNRPVLIEEKSFACSESPEYINKNNKEAKALKVSTIKGITILYAAENIGPDPKGFYKGACVSLFTNSDHKLVANTISGKNGVFGFENIPVGNYRLVITHPYGITNAANISVQIVKSNSKSKRRQIMIYMIGNNFAKDSYAKLK